MKKSTIIWIIVGLVLVGGLVALTMKTSSNNKKGTAVEFAEVKARNIKEVVSASGRIFPVTEIVISSDVSGEIVKLLVEEGDSVTQGQLIAKIDPEAVQSNVASGQAVVNAAKSNVANATANSKAAVAQKKQLEADRINVEQTLSRTKKLFAEGMASQAELDQAQSALNRLNANIEAATATIEASLESVKAAKFEVKRSQSSLKELKTSLRKTSVLAPMSGIVSSLSVEEGERVVGTIQMKGTEIARIANLNQMEVQVEVSENDVPRVNEGDRVTVEVDAYQDRTFKGIVTEVASSAANLNSATGAKILTTDQVTNFVAKISIDRNSYLDLISKEQKFPFRPGMSASVDILTQQLNDVLTVPIAAVTARESSDEEVAAGKDELKEIVWVVESSDTISMREVTTGIQDRKFIYVKSGLKANEKVVKGPYAEVSRKLKEGDKVYEDDEKED